MAGLRAQALAGLLALPLLVAARSESWSVTQAPGMRPDTAEATAAGDIWAQVKAGEGKCLRRLSHGCSEVKNKGVCLHSRDGRTKAESNYSDFDIYDSPCVWCGDSQCTGISDSLCEPLEYLKKGAPKYFPSFLAPGSFQVASCEKRIPLPDLNYSCLMWATEGCHVIQEQNLCLRSLDGHRNNQYLGKQVFKDPCVWCGGGVCTEANDAKCLPFDYLMNGQGTLFNMWHTPDFSTFAACDGAHFRAARIGPGPEHKASFVEEVRECSGDGDPGKQQCPDGFVCTKRGLSSFCRREKPAAGYFITAGKQVWWHDRMRDRKHMVPPGIDCARCGCQGNMTMVTQDVVDAIPTGEVFDNCDDLMIAQSLAPAAKQTAGLFVSAGKQVWWHSPKDQRKHLVEPGIDCSKCGCAGKISLVSQSTLDALPAGQPFNCSLFDEAMSPSAGADSNGRFISFGKQVWWQSPADGLKHLVPPGIDCSNCGCKKKIVYVTEGTMNALRTGDNFDCGMYRSAQVADDLGALGAGPAAAGELVRAGGDGGGGSLGPVVAFLPLLLAAVSAGALCWAGSLCGLCGGGAAASKKKKGQKSRGAELSSDESGEEETGRGARSRLASREPLVLPGGAAAGRGGGEEGGSSPGGGSPEAASPGASAASPVGSGSQASPVSSTWCLAPQAFVLRPAGPPVVPTTVSYTSYVSSASPRSPVVAVRGVDVEQPSDVFDQIDRNHDGQITREEWAQYAFDAFDRNRDGRVDSQEFRQARTQTS